MPGDLRNAFLQVLSKEGTSNLSVVKFRVVDTKRSRAESHTLNASAFNYLFVGCFVRYQPRNINKVVSGQMDLSEKMNLRINNSR
jgi:hypothetical protein